LSVFPLAAAVAADKVAIVAKVVRFVGFAGTVARFAVAGIHTAAGIGTHMDMADT
jgi:hypothetical protein